VEHLPAAVPERLVLAAVEAGMEHLPAELAQVQVQGQVVQAPAPALGRVLAVDQVLVPVQAEAAPLRPTYRAE
jgi:hypothetical protein